MKKIILGLILSLLFVSCGSDFRSSYDKEKLKKWFPHAKFEGNQMRIKDTFGEFKIYVFQNEDEVLKLRKKIDDEMQIKGIRNMDPQKDSATYSNLDSYTVYFLKVEDYATPKGKIVVMVAETNAEINSYTFLEFKQYLPKIKLYLQDAKKK